jgi:hypothetical protein
VKVTGASDGAPALSVKVENLTLVDEENANGIDWRLNRNKVESDNNTLLGLVRFTKLGDLDDDRILVKKLVAAFKGEDFLLPKHLHQYLANDTKLNNMILKNIMNHTVYVFQLDQIAHYFIVEVNQGKARFFLALESFLYRQRYPNGVDATKYIRGCTAREWAFPVPNNAWSEELKNLHHEIGGGKAVDYLVFIKFIKNVRELQRSAKAITDAMDTILPSHVVESQLKWEKMTGLKRVNVQSSVLLTWANHLFYHRYMISIMINDETGDVHVFSNANYDRKPFSLVIPSRLATPFRNASKKLYGMEPIAFDYIYLFQYHGWEDHYMFDEINGEFPFGWTYATLNVSH